MTDPNARTGETLPLPSGVRQEVLDAARMLFSDPYERVPERGQHFQENGRTYYWNFSEVEVGNNERRTARAWDSDSRAYFGVITDVTAVAVDRVDGKPITKWQVNPDNGRRVADPGPLEVLGNHR